MRPAERMYEEATRLNNENAALRARCERQTEDLKCVDAASFKLIKEVEELRARCEAAASELEDLSEGIETYPANDLRLIAARLRCTDTAKGDEA